MRKSILLLCTKFELKQYTRSWKVSLRTDCNLHSSYFHNYTESWKAIWHIKKIAMPPKIHENLQLFCKCHFLSFGASSNLLRSILLNHAIWYVQCTFCGMHNYFRCPIIDDMNAIYSEFVVKYMIHNIIWYMH